MNDLQLALFKAIVQAQIEAAGMTAENMQRSACGNSMAYGYAEFMQVADTLEAIFQAGRA